MRTPPRLAAALAAAAGFGLIAGATPASADTVVQLNTCTSWSIVGGTFNCVNNTTQPPPAANAPAGCAFAPSTISLPSTGGNYSFTASCTSVPATSWLVGGVTASSNASLTLSGTASSSASFTATPMNGSVAGNPITATVVVAPNTNTGGGNTGGGINCAAQGFANTVVMNAAWPASRRTTRTLTSAGGAFGANTAFVLKFTTGSTTGYGMLASAEYGSSPTGKTSVLSSQPCDFGPQPSLFATQQGVTVTTTFKVGTSDPAGYPVLAPNTTYYLNIKNEVNGVQTCSGSSCDAFIDLKSP